VIATESGLVGGLIDFIIQNLFENLDVLAWYELDSNL
jgi:hypothetical protein